MATFFGKLLPNIDTRAEKVSAGSNHNVLLTHDGKVYNWGDNSRGQLGDGTTTNSSTATFVNPTYLNNPNSYSVYFDGTGDSLTVANNVNLNMDSSDFTIECWFFPTSLPTASSGLFSKRENTSTYGGISLYFVSGSLAPSILATTSGTTWEVQYNSSVSCTLNVWNHLAVTRNGNVWRTFVNGIQTGTQTVSGAVPTNASAFAIGAGGADGGFAISTGYCSNLRIVKGTALYTSNFTPSTAPLTAIPNTVLLTCQNSTFKDNSANGFSLTVNGNTTPSTISPFSVSLKRNIYADVSAASSTTAAISVNGELLMWGDNSANQIGITSSTSVTVPVNVTASKLSDPNSYSVYFDGTSAYVQIANNDGFNFGSGDFTLEAWVLPASVTGYGCIMSYANGSSTNANYEFAIYRNAATWQTQIYSGTTPYGPTATGVAAINKWTHVAMSRSGNNLYTFIDGVLTNTTSVTGVTINNPSGATLQIGQGQGGYYQFAGYISNVRIVKGIAVYTGNFTLSISPLTAVSGTSLLTCQNNYIIDNSNNNFPITVTGNTIPKNFSPFNITYENISWKSISLGSNHTLALSADNDVYAWGNNASGQLGNGTTTSNYIPQLVNHISSSSYSVLFDGSGDYLTFNGIPLTSDTTQFTIEAWIYPTNNANQSYIYAQYTGADARRTTFYRETDTTINFFHPDIGTNVVKSGATPNNAWTHVAVTRDSTNTVRLFVNGTVAYTHSNFTNYPQQTNAQIGGVGSSYFVGYISNLRVIKNLAVYTSNFNPSKIPLIATAQTTLLTCQDFNINDLSSSNFKVSASFGDVQVSEFSPFRVQTKFTKICAGNGYSLALSTNGQLYAWGENSSGQLGIGNTTDQTTPAVVKNPPYDYSVYFDGSGDWISVVDTGGLLAHGSENFTYECWIKPTGSFSTGYVIHQYGTVIDGINIVINSSTGVATADIRGTNQASITAVSPTNSVQIGKWNHVAIMRNGATLILAVNGLVYSTAISAATLFLENQNSLFTPLRFGSKSNLDQDYFKGYISNMRIIRGRALYTTSYTVPTAPFTVTEDTVFLGLQSNRLVDNGPFNLKITATGNSTVFAQGPFKGASYKWLDFNAGNNHTLFTSANNQLFAAGDNTNGKLGDSTTATSNLLVETFVNADRSVYFNGASYLTSTLTGAAPGTGEFTYECWFFVDSLAASEGIFNTRSGATADGFNVFISTTGLITVGHTSTLFTAGAKATVYAAKWYHFAITRVGTTVKVYLNYGLIGSFTDSTNFSSTTLNIGCTAQGGNIFNGYISNFRYLNYALYNDDGYGIPTSYSVYFDGSGDYLNIASTPILAFGTGNYTVEAWIYLTGTQTNAYPTVYGASSTGGFLFGLRGTTPTSLAINAYGSSDTLTANFNFSFNTWYYVTASRSGTTARIFVNGTLINSGTDSNNYSQTEMNIGAINGSQYILGYISDLRITNGVARYTSNFTPPTSPLTAIANTSLLTCQSSTIKDNSSNNFTITVAGNSVVKHFNPYGVTVNKSLTAILGTRFLSCQGTTIADNSTNKFAITTTGTPTVSTNTPFRSLTTAKALAAGENYSLVIDKNSKLRGWGLNTSGQLGTSTEYEIINLYESDVYSVYFDGSGDYLSIVDNPNLELSSSNFTIEAWIYLTVVSGEKGIVSKYSSGNVGYTIRYSASNGGIRSVFGNSSGATDIWVETWTPSANIWYHVAFVRSSNSYYVFVNGTQIGTTRTFTNAVTIGDPSDVFAIGTTQTVASSDFAGYMSNFRIVKGTAVYTANFTPSTSPLTAIANTSLLTCQGSTIIDRSSNNFTITVNGNAVTSDFAPAINQRETTRSLTPKLVTAGKEHSIVYAPSRLANRILAAGKNNLGQLGDRTFITEGGQRFKKSQIPLTYSVYYDGASDYLIYPNSTQFGLGTGDFTIEMWVYVYAVDDINWLIDFRTAGGGAAQVKPELGINNAGGIDYMYGAGTVIAQTVTGLVTANAWHHIALVRNSGISKIFYNGIEKDSKPDTTDFGTSATVTLGTVGDSPGYTTTEFNGFMSNVRIVKGIAVYTSNFTPPTAPLSAISGTSLLVCQANTFIDNSVNNVIAARTGEIRTDAFNPFGYLT